MGVCGCVCVCASMCVTYTHTCVQHLLSEAFLLMRYLILLRYVQAFCKCSLTVKELAEKKKRNTCMNERKVRKEERKEERQRIGESKREVVQGEEKQEATSHRGGGSDNDNDEDEEDDDDDDDHDHEDTPLDGGIDFISSQAKALWDIYTTLRQSGC